MRTRSLKPQQARKKETGREITEIDPRSFTDLCTYLWCCVTSASRKEGRKFDMPLLDFADSITPDDMAEWNKAVTEQSEAQGGDDDNGEKKSLPES